MADTQDRLARTEELEALEVAEEHVGVTSDADAFIGEAIPPRTLVPTQREQRLGAGVQRDFTYVRTEQKPPRRSLARAFTDYIAEIDPRHVEGNKRALWIVPLATAFASLDDQVIALMAPEIRADFGFSIRFLATVTSLFAFVNLILAPAMGYLADRIKRVWMVRIGGLLGNAGSVLFGLSTGIGGLVGARLLGGFGGAVAQPAAFPLLSDYFPTRSRARVFSFFGFVGLGFALVTPPLVGNVSETWGWRSATVTFGIVALGATMLLFFLREPVRGYQERREMGASEEVAEREQKPVSWGEAWRASASIVTVRRLWYATPFLTVGGMGFTLLYGLYLAQEFQLSPSARSYIATVTILVSMVGLLFAGPAADRLLAYKPQKLMTYFGLLTLTGGATIAFLLLTENLWLTIVLSLPQALFAAVLLPAQITLFSMIIPARLRGLGMQTFVPWRLPGLIALPFIAGLADRWGIQEAFIVFLPISAVGALIAFSAITGVERDIRSAKASAMADEEARRAKAEGRNKMLICRDVDVTYEGTQVLFNVDFDVEEGDIVALLGTNGAGKSSLLRAVAGVHEASNGAIYLDGEDITHVPPHENARDGVVIVPGGHSVFPTLTVAENLRTAAWMYREDEEYVTRKTEEVLDLFPVLRDRFHEQAGNMSGGEQQMLALGQAFLMKPRLLMIDELSLGLAPGIVEQLLETVRRIHEEGTTIVLVEQSVNVALTLAERAVFMEKGEIRFDGLTTELVTRPELVRSIFIGGAVTARTVGTRRAAVYADEREELLRVEGASVRFGGVRALKDVSLDLYAAEVVGIIGPNGAGKTTLFDVISGFVQPDAGAVTLESKDVTNLGPDARARLRLGRSFQNATLFPTMTVRDTIAAAMERRAAVRNPVLAAIWAPQVRESERKIYQRVDALIEILGLEAFTNKFVAELSTGSRRAVDLACIMAAQPRVLLLDEPSSGLAQAETEELGPVISRLVRETGCGILIIEHDMPLITAVSDRLVAMELGEVIVSGTPGEVVNHPRVVASYLSASEGVLARSGGGRLQELMRTMTTGKRTNGKRTER